LKYIPDTVGFYETPNEPIHGVKVTGTYGKEKFSVTYKTGRKVTTTDLLARVLVDIIRSVGIEPGGVIPAPLIWAQMPGSYSYLIRLGSDEYNQLKLQDELRDAEIIKVGDLKVGGTYMSVNGSTGIYLGKFSTTDLVHYGKLAKWKMHRNKMLWVMSNELRDLPHVHPPLRDATPVLIEWANRDTMNWTNIFKLKGNHSYRKQLAHMLIDPDIIVDAIKQNTRERLGGNPFAIYSYSRLFALTKNDPTIDELKPWVENIGHVIIPPNITLKELPQFLAHEDEHVREEAEGKLWELGGNQ